MSVSDKITDEELGRRIRALCKGSHRLHWDTLVMRDGSILKAVSKGEPDAVSKGEPDDRPGRPSQT